MSRPEHEDVSLAQAHAFRLFRGFEFLAADRFAGFQPFDPPEPGDVQQHSASYNPVCVGRDVLQKRAARRHLVHRLAVVQLPPISDMAKRIDVGVAIAMKLAAQKVRAELRLAHL
jgi:hypothetical protein